MGILDDLKDGLIGGVTGFISSGGNPLGALAGAAGGLLSGSEASAAEDAGEIQLQASSEAIEEQRRAEEQLRRDLAPYYGFGFSALGPLSTAIGITPQNTLAPNEELKRTTKPGLKYPYHTFAEGQQPQGLNYTVEGKTATLNTNKPTAKLFGTAGGGHFAGMQNIKNKLIEQIPEAFDVQEQEQEQGAQQPLTAQPSAFNSRADTLLGTSETNPLLQQAIEMRQDGSQILQNPLLQQMQADVTRRVMANQAARGKLGSGSTLSSLQNQLIPQALAFREQEIAGLTGLGTTAEDLRQREIGNLFQAAGIGANAAARTGAAGITAAGNIGNLQTYGGEAQALAGLGAAQSRQNQIGQFIGGIAPMLGGGRPFNSFGNMARGGGLQQAGPPLPTGGF